MQKLIYLFILQLGVSSIQHRHDPIKYEDKWVTANEEQFSFFSSLNTCKSVRIPQNQYCTVTYLEINSYRKKDCGATLIHWEYALTTAWCFVEDSTPDGGIRKLIKELEGQNVIKVCSPVLARRGFGSVINSLKNIYLHPTYMCIPEALGTPCLKHYRNDIALVRLNNSMSIYKDYVFPIRLPTRSFLPNARMNSCKLGVLVTGRQIKQAKTEYNSSDFIKYIGVETIQERLISVKDISIRDEKVFYSEVPLQKDHAQHIDQGSPYICYKRFCHENTPFQYALLTRVTTYAKENIVLSTFEPVQDHIRFIAQYAPLKSFEMRCILSGASKRNPVNCFICLLLIYWVSLI